MAPEVLNLEPRWTGPFTLPFYHVNNPNYDEFIEGKYIFRNGLHKFSAGHFIKLENLDFQNSMSQITLEYVSESDF